MRAKLITSLPNEEVIRLKVKIYQTKIKVAATVRDKEKGAYVEGWYMVESDGKVVERRIFAYLIKSSEKGYYFDYDWSTSNTMQTKEEMIKYALAKELASENVCGGVSINHATLNNFLNEMKKQPKTGTKEKVIYTVAPGDDCIVSAFEGVKEFKSKKAALKYADELIADGCECTNVNISYYLGADKLGFELANYNGKKLELYKLFG